MTRRPTLLADVAELGTVLRTMDQWEATGGDLDTAHGRRRFVDDLDADTLDELAGQALTGLLRRVLAEQSVAGESNGFSEEIHQAAPDRHSWPKQGRRRTAPDRTRLSPALAIQSSP
jgi:hypothetical protein